MSTFDLVKNLKRGRSSFQDKQNHQKILFSPIINPFNPHRLSSSSYQFPSQCQTLKMYQSVERINQRNGQMQRFQKQQYENIENQLKQCQNSLQKSIENGGVNVQWLLRDLQEFVARGCQIGNFDGVDKLVGEIRGYKIEPVFCDMRNSSIVNPLNMNKKTLYQIQQKIIQKVNPLLNQNKKQQNQLLSEMVNLSNNLLQQLQTTISDLKKESDTTYNMLQDEIQKLQDKMNKTVENVKEIRIREDKFIEQLVEKVIYKMTYL